MLRKKLAIYLIYGKKGSGKSLCQAREALKLFKQYKKAEKRYPELPKRIYYSNMKMSEEIEKQEYGKHLYYWNNAEQLKNCPRTDCWKGNEPHPVHDTDIGHDEIGKDLPAGKYAETPAWFKQMFSHLRKRGNRYLANTQVYEDIDIAFRRQIDYAFKIEKIMGSGDLTATEPAPYFIWGIITIREFDPVLLEWERDPDKREIKGKGLPDFLFIQKKFVEAYNTADEIPPYKPNTLEHMEYWCENPNCPIHGKNTGKPKIEHRKI